MRSRACYQAILLALAIVACTSEDPGLFLKKPLARRHLTSKDSQSESEKKSSSSSRDKSKDSSSRSKPSRSEKTKTSPESGSSKTSPSKSRPKPSPSKSKQSSSSSKSKPKPSPPKSKPSSPSSKSKPKPSPSKSKPKPSPSKSKPKPSPSKSKPTGKGKGGDGKGKGVGRDKKSFAFESEPCGEDTNGGCDSDPPVYGKIKFDQTLIGEFGAIFEPGDQIFQRDTDWFLFDMHDKGCVQATLASSYQGIVVLFEGSTMETETCLDNLVNVASGDSSGVPAVYCFSEAGTYGVFVSPEFMDDMPCEGDPLNYYLALEHVKCGTCLVEGAAEPFCSDERCKNMVCENEASCCGNTWGAVCVETAREVCDCFDGEKIVDEDEPCGEDTNGGCNSDSPVFGSIDFGQVVVGEYGAIWDPVEEIYELDRDWFLFDIEDPDGACVRATLDSIDDGIIVLFEGPTAGSDACNGIVGVATGDNNGNPAAYCFPEGGVYGAFVAPEFQNLTPCDGDPNEYILALEHLDKCGTCLLENNSPGCLNKECEAIVCNLDGSCCDNVWDVTCVEEAKLWCKCAGGKSPDVVNEDEPCGEDINGGCFQDPPAYGAMELGQTLIGEYGAVWIPSQEIYQLDRDWFLFNIAEPGTCVEAVLTSRDSGEVVLFERSTDSSLSCEENLVNVASGENNKEPAVYCFTDSGEFGAFVAPTHEEESPCEGDPNTYVLTLRGLACGTCFIEHKEPGCSDRKCEEIVCDYDSLCCNDTWDATCVEKARLLCRDCTEVDRPSSPSSDVKSKTSSSKKGSDGSSTSRSSESGKGKGSSSRSSQSSDDKSRSSSSRSSGTGKEKGSTSRSSQSSDDKSSPSSSGKEKDKSSSSSRSSDTEKDSRSRSSDRSKSRTSHSSDSDKSSQSGGKSKSTKGSKSGGSKTSKSSKRKRMSKSH